LSGKRPKDNSWGEEAESFWGTLNTTSEVKKLKTEQGDYRDYYRNIYNVIVNNESLIVTGEDGLNVIRIIEAAIKSNDEKRRITLDCL
ncbi:MAG: Gfo/Idh/MocA family oxidoreductase, partial [Acidaminobacteraceae bacterium]